MTSRRTFLVRVAGAGAALALPDLLHADPYQPIEPSIRGAGKTMRVRGRVMAAQRAVRGARVSDGRTVVEVDSAGRFDFVTTNRQRHLSVCPPPGFVLQTNPTGTLRLHIPITPSASGELIHQFELVPRTVGDDRHAG